MNYIEEIIAYFKYLCEQHPLLLHTDTVGERVFEVRDLDNAFGALRTGAKEKNFLVRFVLPTITERRYDNNAWKVYQAGLLVLKYHGKRETVDNDIIEALDAAEQVSDDFIARIVSDSRNGYELFGSALDNVDNLHVQAEFLTFQLDGTYSGILAMFDLPVFRTLSSTLCDAVVWEDGGLTS